MKKDLKRELCNYLIKNNMVKEYDVIKHSYTNARFNDWKTRNVECNNMSPTLDTRCDCLGVVVMDSFVSKHYKNFIEKNGYIPDIFNPYNEKELIDTSQSLTTCCGSTTSTSSILIKEDEEMIINPLKDKTPYGWHFEQNVYDVNGETRSLKASQGSGNILKIIEEVDMEKDISVYSETEKKLFTEDGNIKRYIDSDIVDRFNEGQMATTTFPNGYGHGPRTHDESISLNTIDKPSVKNNLRIRKLTPKECFRLMAVKDEDSDRLEHLSNATKYHLAGDSIVINVLQAIFKSILIDHPVVDHKPIRLIELFGGYGSQSLSLKYLNIPFEHWKLCEWAIHSIDAYKSIHFPNDNNDYSGIWEKEDLIEYLYNKGISSNWNEPMKETSISRKSEEDLRKIFNNCKATNNLINIQQVHAKDLEITERDKYNYIVTYSFPCQDLSLAGKGAGMEKGSGTRSGMLWEVERILEECEEELPQILLMENVPQVAGKKNKEHFDKWIEFLESKGYINKWCMLNAKEVGYPEPIPQNRNRCFMVSVLDPKQDIVFPEKTERRLVLKDLLESEVDEKYYLSDKMINCFMSDGTGRYPRKERFLQNINRENQDVGNSVTTLAGNRATDNFVVNKSLEQTIKNNDISNKDDISYIDSYNKTIKDDGISSTITTRVNASNNSYLLIKNATKQGYLEAEDGDGIDISSRMEYHRGTVQKESTQTITTKGGNDIGVIIKENKWEDLD